MIPALLTLLTTGVGGWIAAAVVPIALAGGIWGAVAWHDSTVRDALLAQQAAAAAAETISRQQAAMSALSTLIARRDAAAQAQIRTLQEISHAPVTTGCVDRPAIADALRGLRRDGVSADPPDGAAGAAATDAGTAPAAGGGD